MQTDKKQPVVGWICALMLLSLALTVFGKKIGEEIVLADADFKKLDTIESVMLAKADKVFAEGTSKDKLRLRQAAAEYQSFALQFPKSLAVPYALLRQGRSLQLEDKRFEAIKVYKDVLDYYPNHILYAGAALCYTGDSHWDNGNVKEAMKAWAEMAKDVDYRKHDLAAGAINHLADNLVRQDKWLDAAGYYEQVALEFRTINEKAANYAISRLVYLNVYVKPDVAKLRSLYDKFATLEPKPGKPDEIHFWKQVMDAIRRCEGTRNEEERAKKAEEKVTKEALEAEHCGVYRYWAKAMEGKHLKWDDYQITIADYRLREERNVKKWYERLDKQYKDNWKEGDYNRTIKWISLFVRSHMAKVEQYYSKLVFEKMQTAQIVALIKTLFGASGEEMSKIYQLGRSTVNKLKPGTPDAVLEDLIKYFFGKDELTVEMLESVEILCKKMQDLDRGKWFLFLCYKGLVKYQDKALALAEELVKLPNYAKEVYWERAVIYSKKAMWTEAINDYMMADKPPQSFYEIAACYMSAKKPAQAIQQLSEIEAFFAAEKAEAALRIAFVYRTINQKEKYVAELRGVLKKYPESRQSSTAHQLLQAMGIKTGGGEDAK